MTEDEKLFAKFFSDEKVLVKDMDDLQLTAHQAEISRIAFQARACLTAIDDEKKDRAKKKGVKTFSDGSALETDDFTSDAINKLNARTKKLSKESDLDEFIKLGIDKTLAQKLVKTYKEIDKMVGMGIGREEAEKMYAPIISIVDVKRKESEARSEKLKESMLPKPAKDGRKCPECDFAFLENQAGEINCPECKTLVKVPKFITAEQALAEAMKLIDLPSEKTDKPAVKKLNPFTKG